MGQIYFRGTGPMHHGFSGARSVLFPVRPGTHEYTVNLGRITTSKIRIDVGVEGSPVVVRDISVVADRGDNTNPFRYAGMFYDAHRGEYYTPNRNFNPRLGRWTQADPFWGIHNHMDDTGAIMQAGNLFIGKLNNPVFFRDPTGLYVVWEIDTDCYITAKAQTAIIAYTLDYLNQSSVFRDMWQILLDAEERITIRFTTNLHNVYRPSDRTIFWDPSSGLIMGDETSIMSAALILAHEAGHAAQHLDGTLDVWLAMESGDSGLLSEIRRIEADNLARFENPIARQLGEPVRAYWGEERGLTRMNNPRHFVTAIQLPNNGGLDSMQHNHVRRLRLPSN